MIDLFRQQLANYFVSFHHSASCNFNAFKEAHCASDLPNNSFSHSLEGVSKVILYMPMLLQDIEHVLYSEEVAVEIRVLLSGIYSYVFSPVGYISEKKHGFLGFVDDALVLFYGMQLSQSMDERIVFESIHEPEFITAIETCENLLRRDLLGILKDYPRRISKVALTTCSEAIKTTESECM